MAVVRTHRLEHLGNSAPVLQHQARHLHKVGRETRPVEFRILGPGHQTMDGVGKLYTPPGLDVQPTLTRVLQTYRERW